MARIRMILIIAIVLLNKWNVPFHSLDKDSVYDQLYVTLSGFDPYA